MFRIKQLKSLPVQDLQLSIHNVRTHAICVAVRHFSHRVLLFLNFSILFSLSLLLRNPISQTITNVTLFDFVDQAENLQETIFFFPLVISHVPHKGPLLICYPDAVMRLLPESGLKFQMQRKGAEKEKESQTERQKVRLRDRQSARQKVREIDRQKQINTERERQRDRKRNIGEGERDSKRE